MENLHELLKKKGYKKVKFKISKTQHLLIKAKVNGIVGDFILDTGASNSCIGFDNVDYFNVIAQDSPTKAAGAGATDMYTQMSADNLLQLSHWKTNNFSLVIFDMSHVNMALKQHKAKAVHGIIGADILLQGKAIIDYYNHYVYLK